MTDYINVHLAIPEEYYELAIGLISAFNVTGVEEKTDELVISFKNPNWNSDVSDQLLELLNQLNCDKRITSVEKIEDRNWNEEWEKTIDKIIVSPRIGIAPSWKLDELDTEIKLSINPKMSFGTGHHSTTKMMCKLAEKLVRKDSFWIDAGTGTGLLAALAIKLGAKRGYAFDNDEWSVENAKENFIENHVENRIELLQSDINEVVLPVADGIFANLFRHLLIASFDKFYDSLKPNNGDLIISGILKYDKEEVIYEAESKNFRVVEILNDEEWVAIHLKPKD